MARILAVTTKRTLLAAFLMLAGALVASASIPEPDHVFYGRPSTNGVTLTSGVVTVVVGQQTTPIASFTITAASPLYVLRIPIDSVDPQAAGTARAGDEARFYINGDLAGSEIVGDRGAATQLDLDTTFDNSLSVADVTQVEGNSGNTNLVFTVTLGSPVSRDVTVDFTTVAGTAAAGADFVTASGTLTFAPGVLTQQVPVSLVGETLNEIDETFTLKLQNSTRAAIARAEAVGKISNDDPLPHLTIDDVTVTEGASGTTDAVFTLSLSEASGQTVTINQGVAGGTATPVVDYTFLAGVVTFPPLTTKQTVTVRVLGDTALEQTETYFVNLTNAVNTVPDRTRGQGWIMDNSPGQRLAFSASTFTVAESAPLATITVKRTTPANGTVIVDYEASSGSATSGSDFTGVSGTLSFGPNVLTRTFTVPITNDTVNEKPETVLLRLSKAQGGAAVGAPETAVLTITDNDLGGKIQFAAMTTSVSEAGPVAQVTLKRTLGVASGVTVDYATTDGTATAGQDYTAATGSVSFAAGQLTAVITIPVSTDIDTEGDEAFTLDIFNPQGGATLGPSPATVTIVEDEPVLFIAKANYATNEGVAATITVKRAGPVTTAATVDFSTSDGSAVAGSDYTTKTGKLLFGAGVRARTFVVPVTNDTAHEPNEAFLVELSNPTGGTTLGQQSTAVVEVVDTDPGGTMQWQAARYTALETAPTALVTVTRTGGLAGGVTIDYATSDGTGVAGVDYVATSGTLAFPAGVASAKVTIPLLDDATPDSDKTVNLTLSNPQGGSMGIRTAAVLSITSASPVLQFSLARYSTPEGALATVTVRRTGPAASTVGVDYATSDVTAQSGADYTQTSGTLTFGPNQLVKTFTVRTLTDTTIEPDESFSLTLSNPTGGAALGALGTAVGDILTGSPRFVFQHAAFTATETVPKATVTVLRLPPATTAVAVDYQTSDGTGHAGTDYLPAAGNLQFPAGSTVRTFQVSILNDTVHEAGETVNLALLNPVGGAVLGNPSAAVLTIGSNDLAGKLEFQVSNFSVSETGPLATITVTRTEGLASGVTVDYGTIDDTAVHGVNYQATAGTLIFGEGELTKTFTVPVLDDLVAGGNSAVRLELSNPTGGATLGPRAAATLWVVDNR